jgi:ribosomal subunit interface protein
MQLSVSGKHLDVGDSLRTHVGATLTATVDRHFGRAIEGKVMLARARHLYRADISVHVARGMLVLSHAEAPDPYAAFDAAVERLETRLGRYKGRLVERRKAAEADSAVAEARTYVLADDDGAPETGVDPDHGAPAIVAEATQPVARLSVREAVLRMDLAEASLLLFRNKLHGGYAVVHRRPDGTIGWIDAGPLPRD